MIIVNGKGFYFKEKNKTISCKDNSYIISIEYIDNNFDYFFVKRNNKR